MNRIIWLIFIAGILGTGSVLYRTSTNSIISKQLKAPQPLRLTQSPTSTSTPINIPRDHTIVQRKQVYQTFNNCGPASLSMQLSYFEITKTQAELGANLRPYQNPRGDNDDKSVTLDEMAKEAQKYGLVAYHRPNGTTEILKRFISADIPVIIRTWQKPDLDIGHYRLIRGYDDTRGEIIQDDSLQGENLHYSYDYLNTIWKPFMNEYLVVVPVEKKQLAESILGINTDASTSWRIAKQQGEGDLQRNPDDLYTQFNLSVASYYTGDYQASAHYFELVEDRLPPRMLWYQIEPINSYFRLKNYERVLTLTEKILNNQNRAFSELYYLRGEVYKEQGNGAKAKDEFEKALYYNIHFTEAQEALDMISRHE